ncbi:MAG: hypothetical protein C5B55_05750 [Blastocatellia bacterium]|nr:MAG: hypothetical protein C5B55_05750 [Blastocatellia bacterium]
MKLLLTLVIVIAVTFVVANSAAAQIATPIARTDHSQNSLNELRDKHSALLIVLRSAIVNADDNEREIIEMVLRSDPHPSGRLQWVYTTISKRLNRYMQKYGSLTAARDLSNADYVIFFNLLEYRRILDTTYPYGELFVIVKGVPELQIPPRIIWRSRKVLYSADAIGDLIHELKLLRGEE